MRRTRSRRWLAAIGAMIAVGVPESPVGATGSLPAPIGTIDPVDRPQEAPDGPMSVYALVTIAQVNANTANGRAALGEFSQAEIRGIAQTGIGQLDPRDTSSPSVWFYVSDGTGMVAISKSSTAGLPAIQAGDSVSVNTTVFTQSLAPLRGTRTLDGSVFLPGTIQLFTSNHPLDAPRPTLPSEVATDGNLIEGTLVTIDGLSVVSGETWPSAGTSGFVRVTDGTDEFSLFVDDDTDLDGLDAPAGTFALTGFVAQNDPSSVWVSGHFVYPRSRTDIIQGDGDGTATVTPSLVTEGAIDQTLTFELAGVQATLTAIESDVPASWSWASPAVTIAGDGFLGAQAPVITPQGGGWRVRVDDTSLGVAATGTLEMHSLDAPASVESSEFTTRTSAGGPAAEILDQPVIEVVSAAQPGDVVINELLPETKTGTQGEEGGEFIELYNWRTTDFVIGNWTLADIGRTDACTPDARWAFPPGTLIPAGGYVVVCRNARDTSNPNNHRGFLVDFPGFPGSVPLFEVYDANAPVGFDDVDHPATPNMVLLDPTPGDNQIALLGGPKTNGGQCETDLLPFVAPFAEAVILRNALGELIDAVRYREPGPCDGDFCPAGSFGDAAPYPYGPPKPFHSLGRDSVGTDTDDSSADLRPATIATPGEMNRPGDTSAPEILENALTAASSSVIHLHYDEVVDNDSATNPANYVVTVNGQRAPLSVRAVVSDRLARQRHYVVLTEPIPVDSTGATGTLSVSGIVDLAFAGDPPETLTASVPFSVSADAIPICDVQSFDSRGFSPHEGEVVTVAGFVTIEPAATDRLSIWVQEPGAQPPWLPEAVPGQEGCGVNVFSFDIPDTALVYGVRLNDLVQIRGRVTEFVSSSSGSGAVTELSAVENVPFFALIARGMEGPAPREMSTVAANDEALEGTLVRTRGTVINSNALAAFIDDGSGSIQVFQNFSALDLTRYTVGDHIQVTGVITQFDATDPFFSGYELVPQNQDAIVELDAGFSSDGPLVEVASAVLVPSLGEAMRITVTTPARSDVIVEIYDVTGRKIDTLYDGVGLGVMEFDWDGVAQDGTVVDPGAYMCHVRAVALDGGSVVTKTVPVVVGMKLR